MPKLTYLLIVALFISHTISYAQNQNDDNLDFHRFSYLQKNMTTPPSPEASSLGSYGEFNVSKYSGRANINVPIYTLAGKGLQIPISLSYDHSGYKVTAPATWVGMGWSLNAFGVITRSVSGNPDTQENYYDKAAQLLDPLTNTDEIAEQEFLEDCATGEIESQPDQYHLSLPNGISAKFYIDPNKEIVQREFQGLQITPTFNIIFGRTDVTKFVVRDLSGNSYTFEVTEETRLEFDDNFPAQGLFPSQTSFDYYSTWYLTEMSSNVNSERIFFEYQTAAPTEIYTLPINIETARSVSYSDSGNNQDCCGPPNFAQYNLASSNLNEIRDRRHLTQIKYVLGTDTIETIYFISSKNTLTMDDPTDRRLDTIRVYRGKDAARAIFDFELEYYPESDAEFVGRLTLKSMQQKASDGSESIPPYVFYYNDGNIPSSPLSLAQDTWGYYNGSNSNTQLIPNLKQHAGVGANRNANVNSLKSGILEEVQYPTGGFTCYEYEKHEANNAATQDVSGLRIQSIEHYDTTGVLLLKRNYRYVQGDGSTSSGQLHTVVNYCLNTSYNQCFTSTLGGGDPCQDVGCSSTVIAANNRSFLGSVQGDVVGYSRVEEVIISNSSSVTSGKTICFYKNNGENVAFDQVGFELLTQKRILDNENRIIQRMDYTYSLDTMDTGNRYGNDAREDRLDTQTFFTFQALAPDDRNNKRYLCEKVSGGFVWEVEDEEDEPEYSRCEFFESRFERQNRLLIKRYWIYPKREITTNYFYNAGGNPSGEVQTTQYYVYGDTMHTQPTRSIVVNSDGFEYETETEYVAAQADGTPGKRSLELNNRWASPFQEIRYIDGQEIYRSRLAYNQFGRTLPVELYETFPNRAEFLSEVMSYDILGNLSQGYRYYEQPIANMDTLEAYQPMAMVWSHYGATLGARVQNATTGEIAYTSFENSDETTQGNWIIPNPSGNIQYDSTFARTGKGYFQATGGSASITSFKRAGRYILSYYERVVEPISVSGVTILRTKTAAQDAQLWRYVEHEIELTSAANVEVVVADGRRLDELRLYPADALMTTFAYNKDTRQMLSSADENAISTRFEYDGILRLKGTRNFDNHYLQAIDYEYKAQFPSTIKNAIKTWNVLKDNELDPNAVKALGNGDVIRNAQYFDNIGRPIQSVGIEQSPTQRDIVSFQVYDEFGRTIDRHLPYTIATNGGAYRSGFLADQQSFISTEYGASEMNFGRSVDSLEKSPINRIFKTYAAGSVWDSKPKAVRYRANEATDNVRNFLQAGAFYSANSLFKTIQLDEDNKQSITYTDKIGRTIMVDNENSKTYYIYDDRGLLIQVIQPTGAKEGQMNTNLINTDAIIQAKSFCYTYDNEYRLASKKIPGTGTYQYFYDDADQLVLTIDPKGFKLFTKYDILGRPIMTGKYKGSATPNLVAQIYEDPSQSEACFYSTNQAFPDDGNIDVYTVNYYDTYDFDRDGTDEVSYQAAPPLSGFSNTEYDFIRGLATGNKTAILPEDTLQSPSTYLGSYLFYDKFRRVVHTQSDNHLQGQDLIWNDYNYPGWLLKSLREHTAIVDNCNKEVTIHQRHSYDHIGRLLQTYHQINEEEEVLICEKSYNERDELAQKRLGVTSIVESSNALQTVDYSYNIRKWLTKINELDDADDLFAMELKYTENIAGNFNNDINYNGNITAVEWQFQSDANSKIYSYEYDDLNRLTTAVYGEHDGTSFLNKNRYNSAYSYDENGNILTLERKGRIQNNVFATVDDMIYGYTDDGRLEQIEETSQTTRGFKTAVSNGIAQYQYDANGNMIQDDHKEITVGYNYLNLPTGVSKSEEGGIVWSYDVMGIKLSKSVSRDTLLVVDNPIPNGTYNAKLITSTGTVAANSNVSFIASDSIVLKAGFSAKHDFVAKIGPNTGKIRHYCNGIEYFDGEMEAIYHEVGRVFFDENGQTYEFALSDHLGNTRVVFSDDGTGTAQEMQQNDFYAFGMAFESQQNAYGYTFGHKEEQNELGLEWLDFGARCLARDIGRWVSVDPLSSEMSSVSPYNNVLNNPISFYDPTGLAPEEPDKRPETPNPSSDLYGREGGSHVIGQSGVLNLSNSDEGEKEKVNIALVPDVDEKIYNKDYKIFSEESGIATFKVKSTVDAIKQIGKE